jgi:hypothetical protein
MRTSRRLRLKSISRRCKRSIRRLLGSSFRLSVFFFFFGRLHLVHPVLFCETSANISTDWPFENRVSCNALGVEAPLVLAYGFRGFAKPKKKTEIEIEHPFPEELRVRPYVSNGYRHIKALASQDTETPPLEPYIRSIDKHLGPFLVVRQRNTYGSLSPLSIRTSCI